MESGWLPEQDMGQLYAIRCKSTCFPHFGRSTRATTTTLDYNNTVEGGEGSPFGTARKSDALLPVSTGLEGLSQFVTRWVYNVASGCDTWSRLVGKNITRRDEAIGREIREIQQ